MSTHLSTRRRRTRASARRPAGSPTRAQDAYPLRALGRRLHAARRTLLAIVSSGAFVVRGGLARRLAGLALHLEPETTTALWAEVCPPEWLLTDVETLPVTAIIASKTLRDAARRLGYETTPQDVDYATIARLCGRILRLQEGRPADVRTAVGEAVVALALCDPFTFDAVLTARIAAATGQTQPEGAA